MSQRGHGRGVRKSDRHTQHPFRPSVGGGGLSGCFEGTRMGGGRSKEREETKTTSMISGSASARGGVVKGCGPPDVAMWHL